MNRNAFLSALFPSPIAHLATTLLIMVSWNIPAFSYSPTREIMSAVAPHVSSPIHVAVKVGDRVKVEALLKNNTELVSSKAEGWWTPLHVAAEYGKKDIAELLLANKAVVNAEDEFNWMPIHRAAMKGHRDVVELLLAEGADFNAKDLLEWMDSLRTRNVLDYPAAEFLVQYIRRK